MRESAEVAEVAEVAEGTAAVEAVDGIGADGKGDLDGAENDVIAVQADVGFAPRPNVVVVVRGRMAPPAGQVPVTSASAVVRDGGGAVLLTYVPGRGSDLPGGHVDAGETPLAACVREVAEETGLLLPEEVVAGAGLAAAIVVEVAAPRPAAFPYPYPRSQMWVYRFDLAVHRPPLAPSPDFECTRACWVSDEDLRVLCGPRIWLPVVSLTAHLR